MRRLQLLDGGDTEVPERSLTPLRQLSGHNAGLASTHCRSLVISRLAAAAAG